MQSDALPSEPPGKLLYTENLEKKKSKLNPKLKIKSRNKKQTKKSQNLTIEQYNRNYKPFVRLIRIKGKYLLTI